MKLLLGDCKEKLKELEDNSIDAIVTDPPYGLSFMGKKWDYDVPQVEVWQECLRVLKPGGYLLSFAGTRTQHRMAVNIEDAGFEIRDMIMYVYGSGFPKSLNIGKSVNQLETNEWSKIGKALDNIDKKNIIEVWKSNSDNVKIVETQSLKNQITVGQDTLGENFVVLNVVQNSNQENSNLLVSFVEQNLNEVQAIGTKTNTALQNVEIEIRQLQNLAKSAEQLSQDQNHRSWNIFTAQCDVKEFLNENTDVSHKVDEALKTLRGNKKYSNEEITSVLCAVIPSVLKLTILNQSKTFQNLDTNQKMECASATNVIITEYTAENLISNTVDILKSKAVDKLQGNEREDLGVDKSKVRRDNDNNNTYAKHCGQTGQITKGTSEWEGWGTALKPSHEPIVWATKSLTNTNQFAILEDINNNLISTIWQSLENLQKQDTFKLQETVLIHLNTALLWKNILVELLKNESKFTTSTASKMITELKILNSLLLKNTQDDTGGKSQTYQNGTQESQVNGLDLLVKIVESCLEGEKKNISDIQKLIVQGLAIYKQNRTGMNVKSAEKDLLPIILNANSVLINVLTDIITELKLSELNTFVNFAEKSLKQYLVEPQSIADENVWQEHIQKALPNHSPICMARKPLSEKTVAENCLKWGTGGINIDGCRVEIDPIADASQLRTMNRSAKEEKNGWGMNQNAGDIPQVVSHTGRFPANLIHDGSDEVVGLFPQTKSGNLNNGHKRGDGTGNSFMGGGGTVIGNYGGDSGSAARFFYCAKASRRERNIGCEGLEEKIQNNTETNSRTFNDRCLTCKKKFVGSDNTICHCPPELKITDKTIYTNKNNHPTVKPLALMEYLVKLVSREGQVVLDPFMGSGTTGMACKKLDRDFVGIEMMPEYMEIAKARIDGVKENKQLEQLNLLKDNK